jgi:hypothetical protein
MREATSEKVGHFAILKKVSVMQRGSPSVINDSLFYSVILNAMCPKSGNGMKNRYQIYPGM